MASAAAAFAGLGLSFPQSPTNVGSTTTATSGASTSSPASMTTTTTPSSMMTLPIYNTPHVASTEKPITPTYTTVPVSGTCPTCGTLIKCNIVSGATGRENGTSPPPTQYEWSTEDVALMLQYADYFQHAYVHVVRRACRSRCIRWILNILFITAFLMFYFANNRLQALVVTCIPDSLNATTMRDLSDAMFAITAFVGCLISWFPDQSQLFKLQMTYFGSTSSDIRMNCAQRLHPVSAEFYIHQCIRKTMQVLSEQKMLDGIAPFVGTQPPPPVERVHVSSVPPPSPPTQPPAPASSLPATSPPPHSPPPSQSTQTSAEVPVSLPISSPSPLPIQPSEPMETERKLGDSRSASASVTIHDPVLSTATGAPVARSVLDPNRKRSGLPPSNNNNRGKTRFVTHGL